MYCPILDQRETKNIVWKQVRVLSVTEDLVCNVSGDRMTPKHIHDLRSSIHRRRYGRKYGR